MRHRWIEGSDCTYKKLIIIRCFTEFLLYELVCLISPMFLIMEWRYSWHAQIFKSKSWGCLRASSLLDGEALEWCEFFQRCQTASCSADIGCLTYLWAHSVLYVWTEACLMSIPALFCCKHLAIQFTWCMNKAEAVRYKPFGLRSY